MDKVKYFEHNKVGRDFVIGDLHGMYDLLMKMMESVNFDKSVDRIFSVGDLVDRGPKNMECLALLYEPWFHAVRGNHEDLMIQTVKHNSRWGFDIWVSNGGAWHQWEDQTLLKEIANKADELPYVIVIGKEEQQRFNIVHAELLKAKDDNLATDEDIDDWYFDEINEESMIWGRTIATSQKVRAIDPFYGLSTTFVGHTPFEQPRKILNHVFIDTGAVYGYLRDTSERYLSFVNLAFPSIINMISTMSGKVHSVQVSQ